MGDVVHLFAWWMAKALALGILCGEETQRRTAGALVFQRLDPIKIKGVDHLKDNSLNRSFGLHSVPSGSRCNKGVGFGGAIPSLTVSSSPRAVFLVQSIRGEVGRGVVGCSILTA